MKSVHDRDLGRKSEGSPSTRRVWIEMYFVGKPMIHDQPSPSTRRVWIEISYWYAGEEGGSGHPPRGGCGLKSDDAAGQDGFQAVTLHAEGVD